MPSWCEKCHSFRTCWEEFALVCPVQPVVPTPDADDTTDQGRDAAVLDVQPIVDRIRLAANDLARAHIKNPIDVDMELVFKLDSIAMALTAVANKTA